MLNRYSNLLQGRYRMSFNLISLATNRRGPRYVQALCNLLGRAGSYRVSDALASYLACQKRLPFISALYANMSVVRRRSPDDPRLVHDVRQVLSRAMRGYTDLYLLLSRRSERVSDRLTLDSNSKRCLYDALLAREGTVLVGLHNTAFDLLILALPEMFPAIQVLGNPEPRGSSRTMNIMRWRRGVEITPTSPGALLEAARNLQAGNAVALGADLPVQQNAPQQFFSHPSRLSGGYARLACMTGARVIFGCIHARSPGKYRVQLKNIGPPPGTALDIREPAIVRSVIQEMESCIRSRPHEWIMPYRVWDTPRLCMEADGSRSAEHA